jgi:hypothetical protein
MIRVFKTPSGVTEFIATRENAESLLQHAFEVVRPEDQARLSKDIRAVAATGSHPYISVAVFAFGFGVREFSDLDDELARIVAFGGVEIKFQ